MFKFLTGLQGRSRSDEAGSKERLNGSRKNVDLTSTASAQADAVTLTSGQRAALERDFHAVPISQAQADFNAVVLASLQNDPALHSWGAAVGMRLRYAALPALLGFVVMYGFSFWAGERIAGESAAPVQSSAEQAAPPLPDLPTVSLPPSSRGAAPPTSQQQTSQQMISHRFVLLPTTQSFAPMRKTSAGSASRLKAVSNVVLNAGGNAHAR